MSYLMQAPLRVTGKGVAFTILQKVRWRRCIHTAEFAAFYRSCQAKSRALFDLKTEKLLTDAGTARVRTTAKFSNATVALILLAPLTFTGVFLGRLVQAAFERTSIGSCPHGSCGARPILIYAI